MSMTPCNAPDICGVQNHRPGTKCRAKSRGNDLASQRAVATLGAPPSIQSDPLEGNEATEPEIDELGIRFYGNTDEDGLRKAASHVKTRGMNKPTSRTRLRDRYASATGVWHIDKNPDEGAEDGSTYSLRNTRMGMQSTLYESRNLDEVVERAAEEVGYDDEDYDPHDWEE